MKNKLVILSLLVAAASTATAQTKEKFSSEKAKDNIFISVGVGGQACMNPDNFDNGFGKAITPQVTLSLGKLFNPVWGIRGQVAAWESKLNTNWNNGTYSSAGVAYGTVDKYKKNYVNLHLDGMMNLSNLIGGYNPDRLFNVSVFAGPGLTIARGFGVEKVENVGENGWKRNVDSGSYKALINGSVGLMGQFNVSKYIDINIEARGTVSPSMFGKLSPSYTDGSMSLTAGVTYTFGGKKFVSCGAKVDQSAINDELNRYRNELAQAQTDLADAKNALSNVKPVTKEVVKEIEVAGPRAIFFQIGKSKIDDYGKVNLELAAKILKANPDKKYKIAGYADKATGNSKWNQKLSEMRAQAVYDALVKEGVSKDQLELIGFGGTANMFGKNFLNRVVILE